MQCCVTKASDINFEEVVEVKDFDDLRKLVLSTGADVILDFFDKHGTACKEGTCNIRIRD